MPSHECAELTPNDIWSMLMAIPAYDRDDWIRVGMALKAYLGDTGFSLFDEWSKTVEDCTVGHCLLFPVRPLTTNKDV